MADFPGIIDHTTVKDAFDLVAQHLPEGWRVEIHLEKGYGEVILYDPNGETCGEFTHDERSLADNLHQAVQHALNPNAADEE